MSKQTTLYCPFAKLNPTFIVHYSTYSMCPRFSKKGRNNVYLKINSLEKKPLKYRFYMLIAYIIGLFNLIWGVSYSETVSYYNRCFDTYQIRIQIHKIHFFVSLICNLLNFNMSDL